MMSSAWEEACRQGAASQAELVEAGGGRQWLGLGLLAESYRNGSPALQCLELPLPAPCPLALHSPTHHPPTM